MVLNLANWARPLHPDSGPEAPVEPKGPQIVHRGSWMRVGSRVAVVMANALLQDTECLCHFRPKLWQWQHLCPVVSYQTATNTKQGLPSRLSLSRAVSVTVCVCLRLSAWSACSALLCSCLSVCLSVLSCLVLSCLVCLSVLSVFLSQFLSHLSPPHNSPWGYLRSRLLSISPAWRPKASPSSKAMYVKTNYQCNWAEHVHQQVGNCCQGVLLRGEPRSLHARGKARQAHALLRIWATASDESEGKTLQDLTATMILFKSSAIWSASPLFPDPLPLAVTTQEQIPWLSWKVSNKDNPKPLCAHLCTIQSDFPKPVMTVKQKLLHQATIERP